MPKSMENFNGNSHAVADGLSAVAADWTSRILDVVIYKLLRKFNAQKTRQIAEPGISKCTWHLIQERQISKEQNQVLEEKPLNREISRSALNKNDRQIWKTQRLI